MYSSISSSTMFLEIEMYGFIVYLIKEIANDRSIRDKRPDNLVCITLCREIADLDNMRS